MSSVSSVHSGRMMRGQWILLLSALAFSSGGFFARQAPVNPWAMLFWRNIFGSMALALIILAMPRTTNDTVWRLGRREWVVIVTSALAMVCYITAFAYTSVANISIIYATAPMITAVFAWGWLREAMGPKTFAAALLALIGVAFTIAGSSRAGTAFGDILALLMTILLSVTAVAARGTGLAAVPTALVSTVMAAVLVLPAGLIDGVSLMVGWHDAAWLAGFGIITMAIAMPCYLLGAADVPASRAMLISASELPLGPLWVWLAFGETTSRPAMIGGVIVTIAVAADFIGARRPV